MGESSQFFDGATWITVAVVALVLLLAQLLPLPHRRRPAFAWVGPDKLLHLLGHAVFSAVLLDALEDEQVNGSVSVVGAAVVSGSYAVLTGYLQQFVPGRIPERADLVAALLGAVLGAFGWRRVGEGRAG